jgi:hypothetical protein
LDVETRSTDGSFAQRIRHWQTESVILCLLNRAVPFHGYDQPYYRVDLDLFSV